MKELLFWRRIDFAGQMLMLLPLITIIFPQSREYAFFVYLTLGSWHLMSCIINAIIKPKPAAESRNLFNRFAVVILGLFSICVLIAITADSVTYGSFTESIGDACATIALMEAYLMLIGGPIMAIWYFAITLEEIKLVKDALQHRTEVHWKL